MFNYSLHLDKWILIRLFVILFFTPNAGPISIQESTVLTPRIDYPRIT